MEQWKWIKWYDNIYMISNVWRVLKLQMKHPQILKGSESLWYISITLTKEWYRKWYYVHWLVAEAFIWERPKWCQVNHIDWNKSNNNVDNLEYVTAKDNIIHAWDLWLCKSRSYAKARIIQLSLTREVIACYESIAEAWRQTNIYVAWISLCARWKIKSSGWYKRQYFIPR